jgi:uncharacterized membrane protein
MPTPGSESRKRLFDILCATFVGGIRQIGFLVERIGDGRVAVFVPDAPTPSSGTILILAEDRIQVLDVPVPAVIKWLRSLGIGSRELLGKMPSA